MTHDTTSLPCQSKRVAASFCKSSVFTCPFCPNLPILPPLLYSIASHGKLPTGPPGPSGRPNMATWAQTQTPCRPHKITAALCQPVSICQHPGFLHESSLPKISFDPAPKASPNQPPQSDPPLGSSGPHDTRAPTHLWHTRRVARVWRLGFSPTAGLLPVLVVEVAPHPGAHLHPHHRANLLDLGGAVVVEPKEGSWGSGGVHII